jgi:hypothetical protein
MATFYRCKRTDRSCPFCAIELCRGADHRFVWSAAKRGRDLCPVLFVGHGFGLAAELPLGALGLPVADDKKRSSAPQKEVQDFGFRPIRTLMSAVTSVNPGIADLSQLLSSTGSASISSALSTPSVQSALQNASPVDIASLSQEAVQLQEANGLFGSPNASQTAATPSSLLLQALSSAITGSTTSGSTVSTSAANPVSELFGTTATSASGYGSISLLG